MSTTFIGGTPQQQAAVNSAQLALAGALALAATSPASPALTALFGSGTLPATVTGAYATALSKLNTVAFTVDLTNSMPMLMKNGVYLQITTFTATTATVQLWSDFWQRIYLDPAAGTVEVALSLLHELTVTYADLVDFAGVSDLAAARALAANAPAAAATSAVNYMCWLRPLLVAPPPPCPPGGLAIASANTTLNFYRTLDGSSAGTPPLLNTPLTAPPVAYGRLAVFGEGNASGTSQLHAYDVYAGQDLWMYSPPQVTGSVDATPASSGTTVWLCTGSGQLVSVAMATPANPVVSSALTFATGTSRVTSCLLSPDAQTLFAVSDRGAYAITLAQPALNWSAASDIDLSAVYAALVNGVLVAASGQTVYGFLPDGTQWMVPCDATVKVLLDPGTGQVLANGKGDSFIIIDVASRKQLATWTPGLAGIDFTKAALAGNKLLVATTSGQLAAYSWTFANLTSTWTPCWSVTLAQPLTAAPVLWAHALIVQDSAGTLYAFDLDTGLRLWTQAGTPAATTVGLGVTAFVGQGDAALYPQPGYQGTPVLVSDGPNPLPAVASLAPGPLGTYALLGAGATVLAEVYQPSAVLGLADRPTSAEGVDIAAVGAMLVKQGLCFDAQNATSWVRTAGRNVLASWFICDSTHQVFGPNVAMVDFNGSSLPLATSVVGVVGLGGSGSPVPSTVQVALAMSGSTAQDSFQVYPGDLDFTERVHISAPNLGAAQAILGQIVRTRAMTAPAVPGITAQLVELKFGTYPFDFRPAGTTSTIRKGSPVAWTPEQISASSISGTNVASGQAVTIAWADMASNPVWIKFDWIFSNAQQSIVLNTSNVLDPTWENPEGVIATMDAAQDAFLQEIYLDTTAEPLVARLFTTLGGDLRAEYLEQLELEVKKFGTQGKPKYNLGKVAKRVYNLTRMSGRLLDATYLQGLFGAPVAMVYQIWSRIKGVEEAALQTSIAPVQISAQTQALLTALQAQAGLDAARKQEVVADLQAIISALAVTPLPANFESLIDACQAHALTWVNDVFSSMLAANPGLWQYIQALVGRTVSAAAVALNHPRIYEDPDDWS